VILTALFLGPLVFRPVLRLAVEVFGRLHTYIQ
jgi:hypothetical protein